MIPNTAQTPWAGLHLCRACSSNQPPGPVCVPSGGSSGHGPAAPVPPQRRRYNLGGTRELWGGAGTLSCPGVPHKAPLRPSPSAAPAPRPQNSAAQWKFPSGASAGASGHRQNLPGASRELGRCHRESTVAAGGTLWSREPGGAGGPGELGPLALPRRSPGSPALIPMGPARPAA